MPQLLSLVGKALGTILRAPSSHEPAGRNSSSFDSDISFDGSKRVGASATAGSLPVSSEPSSRQRSSGQDESFKILAASAVSCSPGLSIAGAQAVEKPSAALVPTNGTSSTSSGRVAAGRNSSASSAGAGAAPAAVQCVVSDVSLCDSPSPPAAAQFHRASRASLSDTTASAAGEALRQASVTTCKHFTRENYNNYVRWVRASRGALRLAGKMRSRVEARNRIPNPTLLLRCEHWLEVTDEQHRYGSNLRVYFDYWVAEMEAAELTPPASPALLSPSPSCPHLVALAQQHQQQQQQLQLASAIASAAIAERASPSQVPHHHRFHSLHNHHHHTQEQHQRQRAASAAQAELQTANWSQQQQQPTVMLSCSPGPGPSRFSSDATAGPRPSSSSQHQQPQQPMAGEQQLQQQHQLGGEDEQPRQLQRSESDGRVNELHHHRMHHHYHHNHHRHQHGQQPHDNHPGAMVAAARGQHGARAAEEPGERLGHLNGDGDCALSSRSSQHWDETLSLQPVGESQPQAGQPPHAHIHHLQHHLNHHNHDNRHHLHDLDLYEREGSVHRSTDDGCGAGADSLPASLSVTRSQEGDTRGGGGDGDPLSQPDGTDADGSSEVRLVASSCDPPPTLLQRRKQIHEQQQQRRRSCGESDMSAVHRPPAAAQPRPYSDAVPDLAAPVALTPPPQYLSCSSPRRNVLCSPSRRFVLAAMIDMGTADEQQQPETPPPAGSSASLQQQGQLQGHQQQPQPGRQARSEGGPDVLERLLARQLSPSCGSAAAMAAAAEGSGGAWGDGGELPPATPLPPPQQSQSQSHATSSMPPATPALTTCGVGGGAGGGASVGAAAGTCTAQRAAKLLSNRASVGSGTSFFRWLDNGPGVEVDLIHLGVSRAKLDTERVKYLTPEELLEYELDVDIETGLLRYKRSGKLLHTGPDGRGSLDEHRRPPTPPPPAVPLSLLGEGAAAWWRGSTAAVAELPTSGTHTVTAALPMPVPPPPRPPRNPPAMVRQGFRRGAAMGTVLEGGSGDGGSGDGEGCSGGGSSSGRSGGRPLGQPFLGGDAAIAAAAAAAMEADADVTEELQELGCSGDAKPDVNGTLLPGLELRGHSASSLARLDQTISASAKCFTAPGGSGSGGSGDGRCSGSSDRPGSDTDAGIVAADATAAAAAAAAVIALGISAVEAGSGAAEETGVAGRMLLAEGVPWSAEAAGEWAVQPAAATADTAAVSTCHGNADAPHPPPPASLPQQLPVITIAARPDASTPPDGFSSPPAAPAGSGGGGGAFGSPAGISGGGDDAEAGRSMPRTPVATLPSAGASGGGGVCHHEEKVAKWIYVVDPELRLFVHPKVRGRFHHSSFLRGGAVVAAGGLAARHGRLRLLTADSGHYWPREENFRWLCEHLVYVGADLSSCDLRSKHMQVPAATGRELMEILGVPPPWRLPYQQGLSPSRRSALEPELLAAGASEGDAPLSPLAEHMHLLQLQSSGVEAEAEVERQLQRERD